MYYVMLGALLKLFLIFTIVMLHVYLFSSFFLCMASARSWSCNAKQTHMASSSCGTYPLCGQMTKINVLVMSPIGRNQGYDLDWRESQGNDIQAEPYYSCLIGKETEVCKR